MEKHQRIKRKTISLNKSVLIPKNIGTNTKDISRKHKSDKGRGKGKGRQKGIKSLIIEIKHRKLNSNEQNDHSTKTKTLHLQSQFDTTDLLNLYN